MLNLDKEDFLSFLVTKESLDTGSIKTCRNTTNRLFVWLDGDELTKQSLEKYFLFLKEEKKLENNTLNNYLFAFRHLRNYCIDRNFDSTFFEGFKSFKKNQPDIVWFTLEELQNLLKVKIKYGKFRGKDTNYLDFRYGTLVEFIAFTGCRPSEAFNLKIKNLDVSAGSVQFIDTKTDRNRTNFYSKSLKEKLAQLIKDRKPEDLVFINCLGMPINAEAFRTDYVKRMKTAGITKEGTPYSLRHSYVTHQLAAGVPIQVVADLVGHADIQTTFKNYFHLVDDVRRRAAMSHPLLRLSLEPSERIRQIRELIVGLHIGEDERFIFLQTETERGYSFNIEIKQSLRVDDC